MKEVGDGTAPSSCSGLVSVPSAGHGTETGRVRAELGQTEGQMRSGTRASQC